MYYFVLTCVDHLRHVKREQQSVTLWLPKQLKQPLLLNYIITFLPNYNVCAFKRRMWLLTIDTRFCVRISVVSLILVYLNLSNIYLENNQNIQYIKHSKYRQNSETSNYCFYKSVSWFTLNCCFVLLVDFDTVPA